MLPENIFLSEPLDIVATRIFPHGNFLSLLLRNSGKMSVSVT